MTHLVMVRFQVPRRGRPVWVRRRIEIRVIVACPVSGSLHGYVVGGFRPAGSNQIILTSRSMALGQTRIFIDDACNGQVSAAIRTGNPTSIALDPIRESTSNVSAGGAITSIIYTVIRLPLEVRNGDDGCRRPYLSTGYDEERAAMFLTGKLTGLAGIKLHSAPQDVEFAACLGVGESGAAVQRLRDPDRRADEL